MTAMTRRDATRTSGVITNPGQAGIDVTGAELDDRLKRLGLSRAQLAHISGTHRVTAAQWGHIRVSGTGAHTAPRLQPVPTWVDPLLDCMDALQKAGIPLPLDIPERRPPGRPVTQIEVEAPVAKSKAPSKRKAR